MKLEHVVPAPLAGKVSYVAVAPGDVVQAGSLLVTLDPADD
jgi:biotin carboxyl carrier protein